MIDRYLAWLNVQIMMLDEEISSLSDCKAKHDKFAKLRAFKDAKNSYCRITGATR